MPQNQSSQKVCQNVSKNGHYYLTKKYTAKLKQGFFVGNIKDILSVFPILKNLGQSCS